MSSVLFTVPGEKGETTAFTLVERLPRSARRRWYTTQVAVAVCRSPC